MDPRRLGAELYAHDPSVQELLTLKAFEGKFEIKDFLTSISEKLIAQSKEDIGPFDPKPFIRTFESAIDTLLLVRKDVQKKSETLEKNVRLAERDYSKRLIELNAGFEAVARSFNAMESKISEVGRTAIRIGEQLESVHISRQRAQAAYDLINFYNQFSRNETSSLDALRKDGGHEGRREVAVILRRLVTVAKEVDVPTAEQTRENIDKYCEKFEKDMLRLFDRSYRKGDPKMMAHCAHTLLELNGGASCVQVYVNQHDFFISKDSFQDVSEVEKSEMWEKLPDPDSPLLKKESGLSSLYNEIRATVEQESHIIHAVFPNPSVVMQVFLQRVFEQVIQQYLERLLNKAQTISTLSFLRVLQLSHMETHRLVEDVKATDVSSSTSRSLSDMSLPVGVGLGTGTAIAIGSVLESCNEELFAPYTEGTKYLERESKSLGELFATFLERFTRYHESTRKNRSANIFDRLANQLTLAANTTGSTNSTGGTSTTSQAAQAAYAFMKFSGIGSGAASSQPNRSSSGNDEKEKEEPVKEEDGRLSIEVAEKIMKWHAEAVGRCVELSSSSDVPKNAFALLRVLGEALGRSYVETALETAQARLESRDSKLEPDLQPLVLTKQTDYICHLWQQYISIALMPLASLSVTIRREMAIFNNQTVSRIEGATNNLLQKTIDIIIAWLAAQLAKQKRNDFKPKDDDLSFARVNTEPCVACCEMLEKVRDAAKENLSGKNLDVFLTEIGITFHSMLLDHLKKFPVNATGGLMLAKDLKTYQDTFATFGSPQLDERFEFIRQLGNVFLVRPEILKSYITENYLGRIEPQLLRPFLMQRSDWGQFERGFDGENPRNSEQETKGLKERLGVGRLGAMMRELEGLRLSGDHT